MRDLSKYFTNEQLTEAFRNTNFGDTPHIDIVSDTILKVASGYSTGHTAMCAAMELGLVKQSGRKYSLTAKGGYCLYDAYFKKG